MTLQDNLPPIEQLEREALIETTRKVMVEAQALSTRIAVLNEIAAAVNETLELGSILKIVRKKAKWLLDFTYFSVVIKNRRQWHLEHLFGTALGESPSPFDPSHPIGLALQTGRPYRGTPDGLPFGSLLVAPIQLGSETIGSLNFGCDQTLYDQDDLRIAYMLSQQLAAAFRNSIQFEELNRTLGELNRINQELNKEQKVSESLLRNILPQMVADELKKHGEVKPVHYDSASVMFIDFVGFTAIAREAAPSELVNQLNWYFTRFDAICAQHQIEKLKTIGDAYMCVSGIPDQRPDHALRMVKAAQDMLVVINQADSPRWQARIGIHSGELVAGVIGKHKFSFDVWGNTVNIASRIESYGDIGNITISTATHDMVKDKITCIAGKQFEVPNLGAIQLYHVLAPNG